MKAISIKNPWASLIADGIKTIETRRWRTNYRGDILVCVSRKIDKEPQFNKRYTNNGTEGMAICVATIDDCRPMIDTDTGAAMIDNAPGLYAWTLSNIRKITPFPVRGQLGIFNVDYKL